jgi:tetratricopeptide (TPR) repeat protein
VFICTLQCEHTTYISLCNYLDRYSEGIDVLKDFLEIEEAKSILVSLHGNNAMVLIKLEDWMKAGVSASAVLKVEKNNVKALFRRGVAYHHSGSLEQAKVDLLRVLELDVTNVLASKELIELNKTIKVHKLKEKESFKGMFNKTMYQDREVER